MSAKINSNSINVRPIAGSTMNASHVAARISFGAAVASLVFLGALHILSPEFDPSWRMVSEYANGGYGWVLSLMFAAWAVSSWALAYTLKPQITTTSGKIGLAFLLAAGVGEAMGGLFDINHPLHGLASLIGIPSLPIAAMLISVNLGRAQSWSASRKTLLWTANLTWISLLLMAATMWILNLPPMIRTMPIPSTRPLRTSNSKKTLQPINSRQPPTQVGP